MPTPLVITKDPRLREAADAAAAASGVTTLVVHDLATIRAAWRGAPVVVIGADSAATVAGLGLPARQGVNLVGEDVVQLTAWSVPLGAAVLTLPDQRGYLSALIGGAGDVPAVRARVLRVVGGSGGVGATTLAAALAQRACAAGRAGVLVELDPCGGGVDLVFGAEKAAGWRWPDLRSAAGHLGDLRGNLPNVSGVDLVSMGRPLVGQDPSRTLGAPPVEAVRAVLGSLGRSHDLIVLDTGTTWEFPSTSGADTLLLVGAEVKAVVAARCRASMLGLQDASVVVRVGPGRRLEPALVADSLGMPLSGVIGTDNRLPLALEAGDPPGRVRRRFAREVDAVLASVCVEGGRA